MTKREREGPPPHGLRHFEGRCPECEEGEAHYVNGLGRVVHMPMKRASWWRRLIRNITGGTHV